jgi:hypothetical protein
MLRAELESVQSTTNNQSDAARSVPLLPSNALKGKEVYMKRIWSRQSSVVFMVVASLSAAAAVGGFIPNLQPFRDETGALATFNTGGDIHETTLMREIMLAGFATLSPPPFSPTPPPLRQPPPGWLPGRPQTTGSRLRSN